jgi:hypothetical protein
MTTGFAEPGSVMNGRNERIDAMPRRILWLLVPALMIAGAPAVAQDDDDDLESRLIQVGRQYATAYIAPLAHGWGAAQNSGMFHTAAIPRSRLTFTIGLKVMGTHLAEDDQTFRRVIRNVDLSDYGLDVPAGARGDVIFEGPTVIGDSDVTGTATGIDEYGAVYTINTISGVIDTRWVPMVAPELQVGGIAGFRLALRWLPEIDLGDLGKTKYFGYGLQWSPGPMLPGLPVDVMIGFFKQEIDLGTVVETDASSIFIAASRRFGLATVYGGLAKESSTMKVSYTEEITDQTVDFEVDGDMGARLTLGATLSLGAKLNFEAGLGKLTVLSAGLLFGI